MAEPVTTPRGLLGARLRQLLWIERRLADDVLPRLIDAARMPDLRAALERHLLETRGHADAVRDVLSDLDLPEEPLESPALEGLLEEHERLLAQVAEEGHLLADLVHAQSAAATEHLETAAYDALASLADALGEEEVATRLRDLKEQEEFALEQLDRAQAKLLAEKVESERL